jgi:Alkyl sulfatase dimerisation
VDTLTEYADRMWRGDATMRGPLADGAPLGVAAPVADGVAVVPGFANVIAFQTADGLVLVDTGLDQTAQAMFNAVRAWSADPYDGNPAHLKPAPDAVLATALAELAGGAAALADRAQAAAAAGDLRLAGDLAELAALAAPGDAAVRQVRAEVNEARAAAERSLMAQGVFRWAARESRRVSP